ncbi:MAG: ribokinase [Alphaproteobacteria bacterium]|nr:ribokinase [Alphaproteobacteria bacterium]
MQRGFYTKVIVVFGSLNIDIMMPLERFPKSGETVLCVTDYLSSPGGKGANQAVAAARVGAKVAMVGKVGDDSFGRRCVSNLKHQSILTSGIGISDRPTGCATIAVDAHGENFCIVASGANLEVTSDQVPDEILTAKNIVLAQMEVLMKETFSVLSRARARGVVTILNAAPAGILPLEELKNIDYLIVNEIEAVQIAQNLGITGNDPRLLAGAIAQKGDLTCIITLEVKGSVAARGSDLYAIAPLPVEAVDTTGAGDVFCGIFAACLQMDRDWLWALHCSSVGAALSCQGMGAQGGVLSMEDIEKNRDKIPPPEKIG